MVIKILFLAADPSNETRLRLGQEVRDIREKLQLSKQRENFVLDSRESVRPGDITQAIHDIEPQIVHFSGHGSNTGELYFEDVTGKSQPIKPDAFANLFKLISDQVSCVILNACYSEKQAEAISQHIPYVIGMSQAIGDRAAIAFAVGFYKALGAGRSVEEAYNWAKVEIELEGIQENSTPILSVKKNKDTLVSQAENTQISKISSFLTPKPSANFYPDSGEEITLFPSSKTITLEEALRRFEVSPIIKRYGTWAVTTYGVECLCYKYFFNMDRVDEPDWVDHMRGKTWPIMGDFEAALSYAREFKKMKQSLSISGQPLKVFLCHGSEDKPTVRTLYYDLLTCGVEPWLDEENLLPGQDWKYEIRKAVRESNIVIVCLSRTSVNKTGFVQNEIKYALDVADEKPEGSIFLIPARLEECSLPDRLSGRQWVDLFQENGFERLLKSLQAYASQ